MQSTWGGQILRRSILACGLLLAFAGMATAAAGAVGPSSTQENTGSTTTATTVAGTTGPVVVHPRVRARTIARWNRHIRSFRAATRRWLTVIHGRPPGGGSPRLLAAHSMYRLHRLAITWQHREHAVWWRANHPPELHAWLCIHHYEGSWTDSGGPYWGGLQMDLGFQETYGAWLLRHKGTADHWSPLEQIWVAVRASRSRGFSPWPNTAHYCGML
ncbi:MAG TPA: hypothetical protein VKB70_07285 [Gaiellaceae bacterium]|nr:hypothetical protein [Gaiellaceae bacterium]